MKKNLHLVVQPGIAAGDHVLPGRDIHHRKLTHTQGAELPQGIRGQGRQLLKLLQDACNGGIVLGES